ncbi:hypothetical protein J5N97_024381 [Dioscorea zingiberensis]|uniref:ADP-ribosylation factor GTPase-activating protein AGD12-like n=1 Tax=Dioscorea zingiberensis TaxID=325984 RepID=A0A9D5C6Z1_9LILI|nr:hypothetical protein J5N97_024381 [Dioscorea zingiberensis]
METSSSSSDVKIIFSTDDVSESPPVLDEKLRKLKDLLLKSDNRICADCGAVDPKWASSNIGVFICLKCSGVHRSLGTHISKVMSVILDEWSDEQIDSMIEVGNFYANSIYEAFLPPGYSKPNPNSTYEERAEFFRNLAIRDMLSSDPYVVLTLGQQRAQTTVIKSNLNPVWNEELKLSVPESYGALKVQVFDHDVISSDDIMGEAKVDLQPMIAGVMAFGDPDLLADMPIGKWLKSTDNALISDSPINIIDGKVKQEVSLKLQRVESGEIDMELQWIPLNQ